MTSDFLGHFIRVGDRFWTVRHDSLHGADNGANKSASCWAHFCSMITCRLMKLLHYEHLHCTQFYFMIVISLLFVLKFIPTILAHPCIASLATFSGTGNPFSWLICWFMRMLSVAFAVAHGAFAGAFHSHSVCGTLFFTFFHWLFSRSFGWTFPFLESHNCRLMTLLLYEHMHSMQFLFHDCHFVFAI